MMKNKIFACLMWLTAMIVLVNCQSQPAEVTPTVEHTFPPAPPLTPVPTLTSLPFSKRYELQISFPDHLPLLPYKRSYDKDKTEENDPYTWMNLPEHDSYELTHRAGPDYGLFVGSIAVYPVAEYEAIDPRTKELLDSWRAKIDAQEGAIDPVRLLLIPASVSSVKFVHDPSYFNFNGGKGMRFLSKSTSGHVIYPIDLTNLTYNWIGFTSDGKYLIAGDINISFSYPMDENSITFEQVKAAYEQEDYERFDELQNQYDIQVISYLAKAAADQFSPSLNNIDAIFQSIQIVEKSN